jgi:3-hydroxyisobutyrate dehydrogenase-like beta-hydroxyacid dehydrogenase
VQQGRSEPYAPLSFQGLLVARVGLIGLGLVGNALAERFLAAGHQVSGFDLAESRLQELSRIGGKAVLSARDAVAGIDVCFLSLPTSEIAESVLQDVRGQLRGKPVIDTTTGEPGAMARLAEQLAAENIPYLDATIVGSSKQVRTGEVLVLVGGDEATFLTCKNLLDCFARQVFYLGASGSGARMKLVVNLVLGLNRAVLAEGLTFAHACGVAPETALEVLKAGLAYSRVMDTKGRKMLHHDFEVEARLSQHHKDVRLMLDAARNSGCELPLTEAHDRLLARAESLGYGEADNSAIITAFESQGGDHRR